MNELIAVAVLLVGALLAAVGYRQGTVSERERSHRIAKEAEARRKEQAAKDAGEAMRSAARQRDRDTSRPATDFLTEEARKGGKP